MTEVNFDKISSYNTILKVISWIFRFVKNVRLSPNERTFGKITFEEIKGAEITLLRIVQSESFFGLDDKRLRVLQPVIDFNKILRIKTRILRRNYTENFRFPIILPSDHPIVVKLVRDKHEMNNYAGVEFLISALQEQYWILKTRKTVKKVIRSCVVCQRFDASSSKTPITPLTEYRVRETAVFEIIGVDLTGPLILSGNQKCWIVIFTCAVFHGVHLELIFSLLTESFLQALRCSTARREKPHTIYSDNGTNFKGSDRFFRSQNWDKILEYASIHRITWKFLPPSGWWYRLIGVLKRILRKVLGRSSLNHEELITILCDREAIMNSRPLTYVSEDAADLSPITLSMFLHEIRQIGVLDLDNIDAKSLNKRLIY
ncbi:uncharacterized protein LOC118191326 [Stegodyphus dumicola]|uniref:uncharacterized protein LOC118191326 n=1 Tax=Stegodyphus dumicola TaxID=202533 RepID=UPI0015AB98EB|nr:uncharacterized protein LOC118191326 [Stegodyphus dumicola]